MAKILIIDDNDDFRSMLHELLARKSYTVFVSEDGEEGLKATRRELPDLVITDIVMPNQDGIGTIMALRNDFPDIRVIAVSGGGIGQPQLYLKMAKELGADAIFTKPFKNKELLETIETLLHNKAEHCCQ